MELDGRFVPVPDNLYAFVKSDMENWEEAKQGLLALGFTYIRHKSVRNHMYIVVHGPQELTLEIMAVPHVQLYEVSTEIS